MHQRSFSRFVLLLSWLSLLFNPAFTFAQKKPAQPNPRQILDRGVVAMGGKEKLKAITSRQVVASVKRLHDGAVGRYELVTQYPTQFYYRLSVSNEFEQAGFNGITGYGLTSATPLKLFNEKDANLISAEAIYRNGYWYHDEHQRMSPGMKAVWAVFSLGFSLLVNVDSVRFENEERANNRVLHGVRFNQQDFETDFRAYFDQTTGRLAREELSFGKRLEIYSYDNYQAVNGILEPHTIRLKRANEEYEIKVEKIIYNQTIDRSKFEVPAETQAGMPPLSEVLGKAIAYQEKMLRLYDQFLYEEKYEGCDSSRYDDGDDTMNSGCWDHRTTETVSFHKGFPVRWLEYDSWKERMKDKYRTKYFADQVREVEKIIAKKIKQGTWPPSSNDPLQHPGLREFTYDRWGVGIYEALTQSRLSNYRHQTIDERDCYAVDFVRTDTKHPSFEEVGTVWIDAKELIAYRMTEYEKTIPRFHKGIYKVDYLELGRSASPWIVVQAPICEGFWLPKSAKGHGETVFTNYRWKGREVTCAQKSLVQ